MASGLTGYDRAFVQVVEAAWRAARESDPGAADDATFPRRRGQLDPSDPDEFALHDTYHYQRHHADGCGKALQHAEIESPRPERPLLVIDIGAGACTVVVALGETWPQELPNVHYYAVEPHSRMRALGMRILGALDWPFGHLQVVERIDQLREPDFHAPERLLSARVLVTFNYVMQQRSVIRETRSEWAGLLHRLVNSMSSVELLIVTVSNPKLFDGTYALLTELNGLGVVHQSGCKHRFDFPSRYPNEERLSRGSLPGSGLWVVGHEARAQCRSYVLSAA